MVLQTMAPCALQQRELVGGRESVRGEVVGRRREKQFGVAPSVLRGVAERSEEGR